jgi:hypothetical protein
MYRPVHTSMYWYILLMIGRHCSVCTGTYAYIPVHASTCKYILHNSQGNFTAAWLGTREYMTCCKGVHAAIYHIIESHDMVHPV